MKSHFRALEPACAVAGLLLALLAAAPNASSQTPTPTPGASPFTLPFKGDIKVPIGPAISPSVSGTESAQPSPGPGLKRPARPEPEPSAVRQAVDTLSEADIRQALEMLRSNYVRSSALGEEALSRATLQGLLERLGAGATVEQQAAAAGAPSPFRAEVLDEWIGYARLGSLSKDNLAAFDAALTGFATKGLTALILDLRATPAGGEFEQAAEFIKRLTPKGKMLFSVHRPSASQDRMYTSNQDPVFRGVIVSLVNRETAGAAEVIAAVLRSVNNALVVGHQTAGQAAEFSDLPLKGGKFLRVAVAEIKLPESIVIFPDGLKPDLPVAVAPKDEAEALRIGLEKGVSRLVFETERVRLNEAALVAGLNPELDEAEAAQNAPKNGIKKPKAPSTDPVLQRAVDLITTVQIFGAKAK